MELFKIGVQASGMQKLKGKKTRPLIALNFTFLKVVSCASCGDTLKFFWGNPKKFFRYKKIRVRQVNRYKKFFSFRYRKKFLIFLKNFCHCLASKNKKVSWHIKWGWKYIFLSHLFLILILVWFFGLSKIFFLFV